MPPGDNAALEAAEGAGRLGIFERGVAGRRLFLTLFDLGAIPSVEVPGSALITREGIGVLGF